MRLSKEGRHMKVKVDVKVEKEKEENDQCTLYACMKM
jgi:hypothetical protein